MKLKAFVAAVAVTAGIGVLVGPAAAGQRHWFYGSYGAYDQRAVVNFGFWGGPSPVPPPGYPAPYYVGYPPVYGGPQQGVPEFYYEVAPGQFVPVYRQDQANPPVAFDSNGNPLPYQPPARQLANVPKPRPKPQVPQQVAANAPDEPLAATEVPAEKPTGAVISCTRARQIVGDFGFTDIETLGCAGKEYGFHAKRDGKDFEVKLSSLSGELIEVKRR